MVKTAAVLILFFCFENAFSQPSKIDSLKKLLQTEKVDSNRVTLLWNIAQQYQYFKPDTTIVVAQQAQLFANRIKFTEGESRSFAVLAAGQYLLGNYTAALNNYMQKLKIEEKRNSIRNYASALSNIGLMYILLSDYKNALNYLYRADSTINVAGAAVKQELENSILTNLGETFYRMKNSDSAIRYFSEALHIAIQKKNDFYKGAALLGLANVYALNGKDSTALINYRKALGLLNDGTNNDMLCETALGFGNVFEKSARNDSALHYAMLAFNTARKDGFLSRELDAANFLSHFYKHQKNYHSAFVYMEQAGILQDSLKGQAKTREAMIISSNEQLRQVEIAEEKLRDKETRLQQLQILAICIFIPIFFIITVAVSRIRIHRNVVRFMGVVSLLIFFEFIILLLHPLVEGLMHHNKVLELLVLVFIGAGLVPLHHKMEHVVLEKLTKNKKFLKNETEDPLGEILLHNVDEANKIDPDPIEEIKPVLIVPEEVEINKNSSPTLADTGDEK